MTRQMHDGRQDGLQPLESLDVRQAQGFAELLEAMSKTAFGGRALGEAYQILCTMAEDESCTIVVTISGALTVAKMGRVLCEMIEAGLAQMIVSTGAVIAHGLSEAIGGIHYKYDDQISDEQLYQQGYNRVYDTLEMEANLVRAEAQIFAVLEDLDRAGPTCSYQFNRELGRRLVESGQMPSILGCAYQRGVPVYVPAFTDSELGLDVATYFLAQSATPRDQNQLDAIFSNPPAFNPFLDLYDYTKRVLGAKRLGVFTIGGGVPRNWVQQVGPFIEMLNLRLGTDFPVPRFHYGVRICPEPVHWGGLSGCTYSEGVSWGKFVSPQQGGRFAEVYCDATIAWPLLVRAVLDSREGSPSNR